MMSTLFLQAESAFAAQVTIDAMYIPPRPSGVIPNERGGKLSEQVKSTTKIITYSKRNFNKKERFRMQTAIKGIAESPVIRQVSTHKILKRIGSTNYEVSIHFSQTSKETVEDKMLRLMLRDAKVISPSVPQEKLTARKEQL